MSVAEKLTAIAENEQKVYQAGKEDEKKDFWDKYARAGKTKWTYAFAGGAWNTETFRPTHDIAPYYADGMFQSFNSFSNYEVIDFVEWFDNLGVKFDTSNLYYGQYMFRDARISRLGEIRFREKMSYTFYNTTKLETIEKLIVDSYVQYSMAFYNATGLTNLTIEGTIAKNGFSVSSSAKLTKESIISIINALSDTTSSLKVTLSKTAVNNAFETAEGAADGSTSEEWANLIATKQNWTISLG